MHPMHVYTCASSHVYGMCMACVWYVRSLAVTEPIRTCDGVPDATTDAKLLLDAFGAYVDRAKNGCRAQVHVARSRTRCPPVERVCGAPCVAHARSLTPVPCACCPGAQQGRGGHARLEGAARRATHECTAPTGGAAHGAAR